MKNYTNKLENVSKDPAFSTEIGQFLNANESTNSRNQNRFKAPPNPIYNPVLF